jgi:hypothetical protein
MTNANSGGYNRLDAHACLWLRQNPATEPRRPSRATPYWRKRLPRFHIRRVTQDDYDKKARELKEPQTEIALQVEQHRSILTARTNSTDTHASALLLFEPAGGIELKGTAVLGHGPHHIVGRTFWNLARRFWDARHQ